MVNKPTYSMSVLVFCCTIAVACGDDDSAVSDGGPDASMLKDAGASADAATRTGTGTGGSTGPSGAGGSTPIVMSIQCGANMCASGLLGGMACCADEAIGMCGMMMGNSCNPPPQVDPSCPSITIPVLGLMASCCAANGMCGLDGSALGMGCVDYKMVTSSLGILGGLITLPPAQSCGDSEGEGEGDGGTMHGDEDAGG